MATKSRKTSKAAKAVADEKNEQAESRDEVEAPVEDTRDEYERAADEASLLPLDVRVERLERVVIGLCGGADRFDKAAEGK